MIFSWLKTLTNILQLPTKFLVLTISQITAKDQIVKLNADQSVNSARQEL